MGGDQEEVVKGFVREVREPCSHRVHTTEISSLCSAAKYWRNASTDLQDEDGVQH